MQDLALILFLPWFAILGVLYWLFPRQPRNRARRWFDAIALILAAFAAFLGTRWAYANADLSVGAMWRQILASLVAYGLFVLVLVGAVTTPAATATVVLTLTTGASALGSAHEIYLFLVSAGRRVRTRARPRDAGACAFPATLTPTRERSPVLNPRR